MEQISKVCFNTIIEQIKRPLFIGVTGDSGSGKSYLVSLLEKQFQNAKLPHTTINHDEFLISRADREPMKLEYYTEGQFAGKSRWEILENMFRLDDYERVISDLKSGSPTSFFPYLRDTGMVSTTKRAITPTEFMLFDTSMMLDKMDFVILVDVTQENIIKRKLVRDSDVRTPDQIEDMHRRVQGFYWLDRGKPAYPDVIIDNNDFDNVKIIQV